MKYFKIRVKLGHLGHGKFVTTFVYVQANSMLKAVALAKRFPCVKHDRLPLLAVEIEKQEYDQNSDNKQYYECRESIFNDNYSLKFVND